MAQQSGANGPLAPRSAKRVMQVHRDPGFRAVRELSETLHRELGAGSTIQMVQLNEETIHVAPDLTGETPPQTWHRY
jgi:hypothetical protein